MSYLNKRRKAFRYAGNGVWKLIRGEAHAKIHSLAAIVVVVTGAFVGLTVPEWCLVIICIGGVFMAEAFNSAIEKLCDKVNPEFDPMIGTIKDIAAGGVLLFSLAAAAVGLIIFLPKFFGV